MTMRLDIVSNDAGELVRLEHARRDPTLGNGEVHLRDPIGQPQHFTGWHLPARLEHGAGFLRTSQRSE